MPGVDSASGRADVDVAARVIGVFRKGLAFGLGGRAVATAGFALALCWVAAALRAAAFAARSASALLAVAVIAS